MDATLPLPLVEAPGAVPSERLALRAQVEKALLGVFGQNIARAPRFQDIVSEAVDALFADPALQTAVRTACQELDK
jgi:hypothetical protein